jgi:hypothetical protein
MHKCSVYRMNFSLKTTVKKKGKPAANLFASEEDEKDVPVAPTDKPIDYLHLREEMAKRGTQSDDKHQDVGSELVDEKKEREALLRRRGETISGITKTSIHSTVDLQQAGLVVVGSGPVGVRGEAKHIARMQETAQVNEKFKNLLKMKTAEREKDKIEAEFGTRPEEIVTKAYLKQKEESLRLERELAASETGKRDLTNMFREMLDSGSYARSKFVDPKAENRTEVSLLEKIREPELKPIEVTKETVKKVMDKVVPESTKETARAVQEQAKLEALKIVQQIELLEGAEEQEDKEQARLSAKERYLERKRRKLQEGEE